MHLIGKQIKDFHIEEHIGQGGMADVYRARQVSVNRDVAIKIIAIESTDESETFARRFAQEAAMIASLEHIHVLPIYEYGIVDDMAYLAMRLLRGGTLADLVNDGPLAVDRAVRLFDQVAEGLAYAHSKGVVHRDLKPSNIMLDDAGNAYLTDFGLAKIIGGDVNLTKTGNVVGTPIYMSPEQLRGDPLDHRSDIYSMGVVLYYMLAGRPPFEASASDVIAVMYKHLEQVPPPPSHFNPKIPPQVEVVILRALAKRPEDRFDNAGEMARQLKIAIGMTVGHASYPEVSPALRKTRIFQRPRSRLRRYWPVGALAALILAVIVGVFIVTRPGGALPKTHPNVQEDATGKATDLTLTDADVAAARQQLGAGGFVAYITCNQTSEYHAAQGRELRDFFTADNLPFRIYDSNNDKGLQLTQIEKARADGAAALIVCALDTEVLHQSLLSVQTAELPLILLNPGEENYGGVGLLSDNYLLGLRPGQLAGQVIRDELGGQADVIILDFPDLPIIVERANALEEGIKEFAPQANIIGRYKGGIREVAKESVSDLLGEGVRFEVVASINDAGSFGAIDALAEAEIDPSAVMIFSVDAEALARQYIRQGYYMRASLDAGRTEASNAAVSSMIYLLAGKPIPERILVPPGDMITREALESGDG